VNGSEDSVQNLSISISADAESAVSGLSAVDVAAKQTVDNIAAANERLGTSAQQTREQIAEAARATAEAAQLAKAGFEKVGAAAEASSAQVHTATKEVARLHAAFADSEKSAREFEASTGAVGVREIESAAARARELLATAKRELEAIRDDNRALTAGRPVSSTLDDQIRATRGVQTAATLRPGGPAYMRTELQAGNVEGSPDLQARYRIYEQANRQIQELENQQTAAITRAEAEQTQATVAGVRARIASMNDEVRFGHTTLEERKTQLAEMLTAYKGNAAAIELIQRESTRATLAHNQEQRKSHSEARSAISDSILNSGYALPGQFGAAVTNLGYLASSGPQTLAVGGAAIAAIGVGTALGKAADVAAKDQEAMERLGVAVKTQGADWESLEKSVDAWATLQARTTTFSRSQTIPALAELATAGVNTADAMKIVRVAEDASAAKGLPLLDVTHALLQAYNGAPRALLQLGVATRDQVREGLTFQQQLEAIEKVMHGQATTLDSYTKKQQQLRNDIEEVARTIGDSLLPKLGDATTSMDHFVRTIDSAGIAKHVGGAAQGVEDLASGFGHLAGALVKPVELLANAYGWINKFDAMQLNAAGSVLGWLLNDRSVANSNLTTANLGVNGGASGSYGGGSSSLGVPGDVRSAIASAANAYASTAGIPPAQLAAIITAVGDQESGLGKSSAYDARTGHSRTAGNQGHGIFQLDPASGASQADLDRAASDVGFAANKAASMLADSLKRSGGNVTAALAAYNAGGMNAAGLAYARQVEARIGPTNLAAGETNRADTNVQGRQASSARAVDPFQEELKNAQRAENEQRLRGIAEYRQNYESALQSIITKYTDLSNVAGTSDKQRQKDLDDAGRAEALLNSARAKDTADQTKAERAAAAERDKAYTESVRKVEGAAAKQEGPTASLQQRQAGYEAEMTALKAIRDLRAQSSDPKAQAEVDSLDRKMTQIADKLAGLWRKYVDEEERSYKASGETLDAHLAKLKAFERGASPDQKQYIEHLSTTGIESKAKDVVKSLDDAITAAIRQGTPRKQVEQMYRDAIRTVAQTPNRQDATAADTLNAGRDKFTQSLRGDEVKDADAAISALDRKYKELNTDIADGIKLTSDSTVQSVRDAQNRQLQLDAPIARERALLAATEAEIADLEKLKAQWAGNAAVVDDYQKKIDALGVTVHDTNDKIVQDERAALQARTDEYQKFADSATSNMAKIWTNGQSAMQNFRDIFKSTIGDLEQQMLKSAFSQAFFGGAGAGDVNIKDSLQRTMFGGVAPVKPGDSPAMIALEKKITESPRGTASDLLHVVLHGDPALGTGGGGSSLANAAAKVATDLASGNIAGAVGDVGAAAVGKSFSVSTSFNGAGAQVWDAGTSIVGGGPGPQGAWGNYAQVPIAGLPPIDYGMYGGQSGSSNQYADASNYTAVSPNGSGSGSSGARGGGALARDLSYAQGAYSLYQGLTRGGTAGETLSGVGGIVGTALGGPLGGFIGSTAGNLLGSVFGPHWGPASNYPDRSDTQRYGQIMADLYGTNSSNGQSFTKDQATADLFFRGTTNGAGAAGVERLLAGGQASYTAQTGRTAAQYAQDLAMFGQDANALGTGGMYTPTDHIGTLASHATGAKGSYSYTDYGSALAAIEQGLSTNQGGLGAFNTYSLRRALPDYNLALMSGGTAVQQALQTGTGPVAAAAAAAASNAAAKTNPVGANEPRVVVNAQNSTFVGADGISGLTDLITTALARKQHGTLPNPTANRRVLNV